MRLERIQSFFAQHRLAPPAHILQSESGDLARGLLMEEPFIALMGEGVLRSDILSGNLAMLPDLGFHSPRTAFLFTRRSGQMRTAVHNLSTVLKDVAKEFN